MKERIYRSLCLMSLAALVFSMAVSLVLYFNFYRKGITENLISQAQALGFGIEAISDAARLHEYKADADSAADAGTAGVQENSVAGGGAAGGNDSADTADLQNPVPPEQQNGESSGAGGTEDSGKLDIPGVADILYYLNQYHDKLLSKDGMSVRVTLIGASDGDVKFDTDEDEAEMGSHLDRPEFKEALEKGTGTDERRSRTFGISTRYAAVLMPDIDLVIRVSAQNSNLAGVFVQMLPLDIIALLVLSMASFVLANRETQRIIEPLDEIAEHIRKLDAPVRDTDHTEVYEELKPFVDSVRQSQRVREEFSANVSHELKTPLTSISGFAEMMKSGMVTDKEHIQEFSETIYNESQRLLSLIDDIMRLSRIEEGNEEISETLNLNQIAQDVVSRLAEKASKYQISVSLEGDPAYIIGNRTMIEEMIFNLTDNAIKYNHPGGHVYLLTGMRDDAGTTRDHKKGTEGADIHSFITVADDGIGIPKEDLNRVWERFYRVDKSHSRAIGGTGLGLSIVKHAAERHHAALDISSEEGEGTSITATFEVKV